MLIYAFNIYILFILISFLYILRNSKNYRDEDVIVILSGPTWDITRQRLLAGLILWKSRDPRTPVAVCGLIYGEKMGSFLNQQGVRHIIIQNLSRTTIEDALYLKDLLPHKSASVVTVVTSLYHQRRAVRTFKLVFKQVQSFNAANELFSIYTPLLPLYWLLLGREILCNLYYIVKPPKLG